MRKPTLPLVVLIYVLFATAAQAQVTPEQARDFQINPTHTGSVSSDHVVPPLRQRWSVNFGQLISYPLIADGRVYVSAKYAIGNGTTLYALDAAHGDTLWSYPLGGKDMWSASCYENGRVFAVNGSGLLRAFDGANGNLIWSVQLPGQFAFSSAPTVVQGVIYLAGAGSGGTLYAVNANSGAVLWTKSVWNGDNSSPAVTSDGVYVSYACPNVYKINPTNGAQIWWYAPGCSGGGGTTPALYNGRLYVRDFSDVIFDSQTGTIIGNFRAKNTPAFAGNLGFFLNGSHGFGSFGTLEARDVNSNTVVWNFAGDGQLQSAVLVVNNYVYVGSAQGRLYAVDANTGQQVWTANTGVSIPYVDEHNASSPLTSFAAAEGLLVIPTSTTLIAYEGADWTPPTLTWGVVTPAANAAGWNNTAVDLPFTTADDLSGVRSATPGSPLHFTSEGSNQTQQVTATDKAGNSAQFTSPVVKIDLTAPTTQAILPGVSSDGQEWYQSSVPVTFNASDYLSGVANTFYSLDGGATQTYSALFEISGEGVHNFEYWSVDVAGNTETHHNRTVRIDTMAPVTHATLTGTRGLNGWYNSAVDVLLYAEDNGSGTYQSYYKVDGGPQRTFPNPFTLSISADGQHTIEFWSTDYAGNLETHHTQLVNIDTTPPATSAAVSGTAGSNGWYTSAVQISLTASDNTSGVQDSFYRLDGGAPQTYGGQLSISATGQHTVQYWSMDGAGIFELQKSLTVNVDTSAPVSSSSVSGTSGTNGWYTSATQLSLSASDDGSGVQNSYYQLDGGAVQTYSGPFGIAANGQHTVEFWSVDVAGNAETHQTRTVTVDTTAPVSSSSASGTAGNNGWYTSAVQVSLSATDDGSGVQNSYYQVDGGAVQTYSSPFSVSANGQHTVDFWSVDVAGNTETHQTRTLTVDTTAPVSNSAVSGTAGTNGWYVSGVQVSVSSSDNSSGVQSSYYQIDGGAVLTYASPVSISANGLHTVDFWSADAAGNTETHQSRTVRIDTGAPVSTSTASGTAGANGWYVSAAQVSLSASDAVSGLQASYYQIDGGPIQTYAGPFGISVDGQHTVEFWSVDAAGNTEGHQTRIVRIDTAAPVTGASVSGTAGINGWYAGPVQVSLSPADNASGVPATYFQVDGGAAQTYTSPFSISVTGQHTVRYWSVDAAGNTEAVHSLVLGIDTGAPLVTATANPNHSGHGSRPATFTVSGSATDSLSGLASVTYNVIDEYGVAQPSGSVVVQANGAYSFTLSLPATKNTTDKDGHIYTIVVRGTDQAGNSTSATTTYKVT